MAWHSFSVITDEQTAPHVADFFDTLGAVSVTYMDAEDEPVYEPALGETKIWQNTQVTALFELDHEPEVITARVLAHFLGHALTQWQYTFIDDQAWERAWMDYYQPMKFADRLWVCPTGQEHDEVGTVCLTLDPGLAFGTGTHPTTALCLEWLASHELGGKQVIDYGCGSGILAIAALLLGAHQAFGVDIDPQAMTATEDNAQKNHVSEQLHSYLVDNFPAQPADVVLANILAKPLIDMSATLSTLVKPGGQLILSGILAEQAQSVIDAYEAQGIVFAPITQQEDWVRLDGQRNKC